MMTRVDAMDIMQSNDHQPMTVMDHLQGSNAKLETTLQALSSSVSTLKAATADFKRFQKVTAFERRYEMVTEHDVATAQGAMAEEMAPQIRALLVKAEVELGRLANEEHELEHKVIQEEERQAKMGQDDARQAQMLAKMNDEERTRRIVELSEKQRQLLSEREQLLRSVDKVSQEVKKKERELASLERAYMQREKLHAADEEQLQQQHQQQPPPNEPTTVELDSGPSQETQRSTTFEPIPQQQCETHLAFARQVLETLRDRSCAVVPSAVTTFAHQAQRYLEAIQNDQSMMTSIVLKRQELEPQWIAHVKAMCKVLFPDDHLGTTAGRLLDILLSASQDKPEESSVRLDDLVQEFPPERERRHRLSSVIWMLTRARLVHLDRQRRTLSLVVS